MLNPVIFDYFFDSGESDVIFDNSSQERAIQEFRTGNLATTHYITSNHGDSNACYWMAYTYGKLVSRKSYLLIKEYTLYQKPTTHDNETESHIRDFIIVANTPKR